MIITRVNALECALQRVQGAKCALKRALKGRLPGFGEAGLFRVLGVFVANSISQRVTMQC